MVADILAGSLLSCASTKQLFDSFRELFFFPAKITRTCRLVAGRRKLAVHFHDTYGQALANILVALEVRRPRSLISSTAK